MNKNNKVLLIGWDAADWKVIWPLISKGQMPALEKLIKNGVYGNMNTMNPPYSPMLWSSVATGKTPDKHGILGFIEPIPSMKGVRPVSVTSRKSKAIWNILHYKGLKSNLVGWWPSHPAEPIKGAVITDKFQRFNKDPKKKSAIPKGAVHPEQLIDELSDLRMHPSEVTEAHILPFIPKAAQLDQSKNQGLQVFARFLTENTSLHSAATYLMRTKEWDFMAVYYDFIDHICHAFMKYYPPKLEGVPRNLYDIYNEAVIGAYRFQDMMLERTLELIDKDTTVIVMSDHGFESGHKRILKMPKYPAAPALEHRQFGIFVASGPNIKKNEKVFGLGLIDIAPTILHIFDLPVGRDMDGTVALDIFKKSSKPKYIDSWEGIEGDFGQHAPGIETDQLSEQETMQQLVELGYIEKPDEKIEIAILKTVCDLKHNLARVYWGKKDFDSAKPILLELIKEKDPIDVIPYYMDLLTISLAQNDFDLADEYLKQLRTLDKKFEINTYFSEAKILLGKGKIHQALKILEEAKDNKPNSEVWYQIGNIYFQLYRFNDAKNAYEQALGFEVDKAKFHQALAATLIHLGEFEEASEHALTAIELVKYFPDAHYVLGEALEKLGDLENAKLAFETAARLKPKKFHKAERALENVAEKISNPKQFIDKNSSKHRKGQIVIISGLPRSGTSLMMQILNEGGVEALTDNNRKADKSNPKGYFEYDPVMAIHKDNTWLGKAQNKSLKVVAPLLKYLDPKYRYKVIFMNRDISEVIKSQQKMKGKNPDILPINLFEAFKRQLSMVEIWKNEEPGVELIYVNYQDVLNNTQITLEHIESFIGLDLNKQAMASCVDKTLYRTKA